MLILKIELFDRFDNNVTAPILVSRFLFCLLSWQGINDESL